MAVLLGCGGQWETAPWTLANLNSSASRLALARQYVDSAVLNGMDGLSLDVEYDGSVQPAGWYRERAQLLALFVCELRNLTRTLSYVPKGFRLTFTSDADPGAAATARFDYAAMARCVDYFVPMAYHMPVAELATGVQQYAALGVPASNLVLAFAWFGSDVVCTNASGACAPKYSHCYGQGSSDGHVCEPGYSTIAHKLLPLSSAGAQWDAVSQLPFVDYVNRTSLERHRVRCAG